MPNIRIALTDQVHYSGNAITGSVLLDLDTPKSYKEISLLFSGKSCVHWIGGTRNVSSFANVSNVLWSRQSVDEKLNSGQYNWPFRFQLSQTAPSSFEGRYGFIRYTLTVTIRNSALRKSDHRRKVHIPVKQLASISNTCLLQPLQREISRRVSFFCTTQPIAVFAYMPKGGFYIGESFQPNVLLQNGSSRRITLTARIEQRVLFLAQGRRRVNKTVLLSLTSDRIPSHSTHNWQPTVEIPEAVIINQCENIEVQFFLRITCKSLGASDFFVAVPLTIGNFRGEQNQLPAAVAQPTAPPLTDSSQPVHTPLTGEPHPSHQPALNIPNIPYEAPPSYESVVGSDQ